MSAAGVAGNSGRQGNIAEILLEQVVHRPDQEAIVDVHRGRERVLTFAELADRSARGAAFLRHCGLKAGDTVLVFQPMSAELYIALLAMFRLGVVAMFVDPSAGRGHIGNCLAMHSPQGLLGSAKAQLLRLLSFALRDIPITISFARFVPGARWWGKLQRMKPVEGIASCMDDTPALITFTSGSTGLPKGVVRSHGFLRTQHAVLAKTLGHRPGSRDLTTLPIFVLANLASGITSIIPDADLSRPGAINPLPVLEQIDRWQPATSAASPAFFTRLAEGAETAGRILDSFATIHTGGAPVFPDQLKHFERVFAGADVVGVYGSTEAEPIAHITGYEMTAEDIRRMGEGGGLLTGRPIADIDVRVIRASWGRPLAPLSGDTFAGLCLPAGAAGEIVVHGGHVLTGYLQGRGDDETKFRVEGGNWHRTGDCGLFDDEGRLWLLGRAGAVIDDERGILHPFSVECAARNLPQVAVAALLRIGRRRVLFVQSRAGEDVNCRALQRLLSWAELDDIRPIRQIPLDKRHNAKVDYTRLAKLAG